MGGKSSLGLGPRERQIMDALYRDGEATVNEVLAQLDDPPSYSAVRATLNVLEEKGVACHREDGRRYVYYPAVETEDARDSALQHLVGTFFEGSAAQAAVALLRMEDTGLAKADLTRLAERIDQARKEGR